MKAMMIFASAAKPIGGVLANPTKVIERLEERMIDFDVEFCPPGGDPITLPPVGEGEWTITSQRDDDLVVHVHAGPTADKLRTVPLDAHGTISDGTTEVKVRVRSVEEMHDGSVKLTYEPMSFPYRPKRLP